MVSDPPRRAAFRQTLLVRLGEGYQLTAPGLYVWEETLRDALARGAELGALPERDAWRRCRGRDPAPAPAHARRRARPESRPR